MTEEELKVIEARANAATPGPWTCDRSTWVISGERFAVASVEVNDDATAAFVCAARTDIPALLAEVRDARAELTRLHALHEKWIGERAKILNDAAGGYTRDAALEVFNGVLEDFASAMRGGDC